MPSFSCPGGSYAAVPCLPGSYNPYPGAVTFWACKVSKHTAQTIHCAAAPLCI